MSRKLLILIIALSLILENTSFRYKQPFLHHQLVPDIISTSPLGILKVTFPNGIEAELGNELAPGLVVGEPSLEWNHVPDRHYTVVFCDPDAPSRKNPVARSFLHWLVVNIPGDDVKSGATLTTLINSHPEPETGLHRYLFLVYEQPKFIEFEEMPDDSFERRSGFSPEEFARKYNLGTAVAGNFYLTETLLEH